MVSKELIAKCATEFIGTFFLCFTIAAAAGQGAELAPVAIGFTLTCMVYAGGHVSGAHYNPAVTLAIALRGKAGGAVDVIGYLLAEFGGGALGGGVASVLLNGGIGYAALGEGVSAGRAAVAEIVITMALTNTVLNVATSAKSAGNDFFGLAIGCTVLSGAISVGGISGGAFNPAVAMLGVDASAFTDNLWIPFTMPLVGGVLGWALFRLTADDELSETPRVPEMVRMLATEFWGTFMLCFTVACAAGPGNGSSLAALSIGLMLMAQVYTGGATSGANYNPAVTIALLVRHQTAGAGPACARIRKMFSPIKAAAYIFAQCGAALLAGLVASFVYGGHANIGYPYPASGVSDGRAFLAELVATYMLTYVVLHVATAAKNAGNNFFGLAIGFTVASMAVTVGGISGGAFNPAVGLLGVVGGFGSDVSKIWIFWVACPLAGVLVGLTFRVQVFGDFDCAEEAIDATV